ARPGKPRPSPPPPATRGPGNSRTAGRSCARSMVIESAAEIFQTPEMVFRSSPVTKHHAPLVPRSALGRRLEAWSRAATDWTGSSWAFGVAALVILVWLVTGPLFHFSDTWQLVINTGTTVVTFLMVFLIQRTQNKDAL